MEKGLAAPPRPGLPYWLTDATDFGSSRDELSPEWIVRTLASQPQLSAPLCDAAQACASPYGAARMAGSWELAYLAFVYSDSVDIEPWWTRTNAQLWKAAGFAERPSYPSVARRFAELEDHAEAFAAVAALLIARAIEATDGKVGAHVHVDSTEAQTNARLIHDCPRSSACHKRRGAARRPRRITASAANNAVREDRQAQAAGPEPADPSSPQIGDADQVQHTKHGRRVQVRGCWWRLRDPDAGARAYSDPRGGRTKRFWLGYYNSKAVDHYTGATLAVHISAADQIEAHSYPQLYERLIQTTGRHPSAVIGDRGYSISSVYEHNTRRGVASVFPWRANGSRRHRFLEDTDRHDRHGIPRCRYCGAPTRFVRFQRESNSGPRLHVRCAVQTLQSCRDRVQSISCHENWRMLVPLWRTSEPYQALRHAQSPLERVHGHWRQRYRVAGDSPTTRPKRIGAACQQLRANAAIVIEWLAILAREGWLASLRPLKRAARKRGDVLDRAEEAVENLLATRRQLGLNLPYGQTAAKLGIGQLTPTPGKTAKAAGAAKKSKSGTAQATGNKRRQKARGKSPPGG